MSYSIKKKRCYILWHLSMVWGALFDYQHAVMGHECAPWAFKEDWLWSTSVSDWHLLAYSQLALIPAFCILWWQKKRAESSAAERTPPNEDIQLLEMNEFDIRLLGCKCNVSQCSLPGPGRSPPLHLQTQCKIEHLLRIWPSWSINAHHV